MSRIDKYKEMLSHLTNEDYTKAEELFHNIVVESARDIYGDIVSETDEDDELGGDMGDDFISDIEAGEEEIEADELHDGEVETDDEVDGEELDTEERVEDLEAQLAELRIEFENLMKGELDEPYHDEDDFDNIDSDGKFKDGDEEDTNFDFEGDELEEATKFSDQVSVDMSKEGQLAGTGDKSDKPNVNAKSTYSSAQRTEKEPKGKGPVDFGGGDEKGNNVSKPAKQTTSTNVKEEPKSVSQPDQKGEGKYVGTGKGSKSGKVQTKSPLTNKPA